MSMGVRMIVYRIFTPLHYLENCTKESSELELELNEADSTQSEMCTLANGIGKDVSFDAND